MEMSEDTIYLTPLDIRDYLYCPHILYLKRVRGIEEPETELMRRGKELYDLHRSRSKRRKTLLGLRKIVPDEIWFNIELFSRKYRVFGVADAIYRVGTKYGVLEIKYSEYRGKVSLDHLYQAISYAMMYEENFGKHIYWITLYYTENDRLISRRFTKLHRDHWCDIVRRIWNIIDQGCPPRSNPDIRKCNVCFYRKICIV